MLRRCPAFGSNRDPSVWLGLFLAIRIPTDNQHSTDLREDYLSLVQDCSELRKRAGYSRLSSLLEAWEVTGFADHRSFFSCDLEQISKQVVLSGHAKEWLLCLRDLVSRSELIAPKNLETSRQQLQDRSELHRALIQSLEKVRAAVERSGNGEPSLLELWALLEEVLSNKRFTMDSLEELKFGLSHLPLSCEFSTGEALPLIEQWLNSVHVNWCQEPVGEFESPVVEQDQMFCTVLSKMNPDTLDLSSLGLEGLNRFGIPSSLDEVLQGIPRRARSLLERIVCPQVSSGRWDHFAAAVQVAAPFPQHVHTIFSRFPHESLTLYTWILYQEIDHFKTAPDGPAMRRALQKWKYLGCPSEGPARELIFSGGDQFHKLLETADTIHNALLHIPHKPRPLTMEEKTFLTENISGSPDKHKGKPSLLRRVSLDLQQRWTSQPRHSPTSSVDSLQPSHSDVPKDPPPAELSVVLETVPGLRDRLGLQDISETLQLQWTESLQGRGCSDSAVRLALLDWSVFTAAQTTVHVLKKQSQSIKSCVCAASSSAGDIKSEIEAWLKSFNATPPERLTAMMDEYQDGSEAAVLAVKRLGQICSERQLAWALRYHCS